MITVDARGEQCPVPVVKTIKAINAMKEPGIIEVLVDNEVAVQNVSRMAANNAAKVKSEKIGDREYRVEILIEDTNKTLANSSDGEDVQCQMDNRGDYIVVVSSATMGTGNDELGKVLIKGFIYALTQMDKLPSKILFYNGGAALTVEGSPSLDDLKSLEAQGVEILTCGTCLDYYGVKDKLAVGGITNMYVIVESMTKAGKIVRP